MLKNAYLLAKVGADTAENARKRGTPCRNLTKFRDVTGVPVEGGRGAPAQGTHEDEQEDRYDRAARALGQN